MTGGVAVATRRVTDLIWDERGLVSAEAAVVLTPPGTGERVPALAGQFALHRERLGTHELVRDALGVNKLFFAIDGEGGVESSNYWIDLLRAGHRRVWSVPAGHVVRIVPAERTIACDPFVALPFPPQSALTLGEHGERIRARLEKTFERLRSVTAGRPLYVTLSGGLDSTGIAVLAREILGPFTAITFALDASGSGLGTGEHADEPGTDLHAARRVAHALGVEFQVVRAQPDELVGLVDEVLVHGQDFRDFNVHCGLVNAALAAAIAARHPVGPRPVLLTGDTMNELLADYAPETYKGATYYPLPRLPRGRLRRHLVNGLDAGDREIGIFARHGLDAIQPYAMCADEYAALPDAAVESEASKRELVEQVLGDRVPRFVYDRPKVRAQVGGGAGMGTMGLLLDRGMDAAWLEARFAALFGMEPFEVKGTIRAGRYRFPTSYPPGDVQ